MLERNIPFQALAMTSTAPLSPELRALVIDDNIDAANALSYLLQLHGCRTAVAFGGSTGLRIAQLFKPVVVFLDLEMSGEDGGVRPDRRGAVIERRLLLALPALPHTGSDTGARRARKSARRAKGAQ